MPKLKRLSGQDVIKIFKKFGVKVHSQRGDHVKLRRVTAKGKETLTIPDHKELGTGMCRAILRQASKYIEIDELMPYFYS